MGRGLRGAAVTVQRFPVKTRAPVAQPALEQLHVRKLQWESDAHYLRRVVAIRALGVRWVRHPAYQFDARHSTNLDLWAAAREPYAEVARAAAADRARNPAYLRADAVRAVLGVA